MENLKFNQEKISEDVSRSTNEMLEMIDDFNKTKRCCKSLQEKFDLFLENESMLKKIKSRLKFIKQMSERIGK